MAPQYSVLRGFSFAQAFDLTPGLACDKRFDASKFMFEYMGTSKTAPESQHKPLCCQVRQPVGTDSVMRFKFGPVRIWIGRFGVMKLQGA